MISLDTGRALFRMYDKLKIDSRNMSKSEFIAHASKECLCFSQKNPGCGTLFVALIQALTETGGQSDARN